MHGHDLTYDVQTGLAWYFLLCALLNIGAAVHWTFWSRGRAFLKFEQMLLAGCAAGYGLTLIGAWPLHLPKLALFWIATLANVLALLVVLPASVYKKVTGGIAWSGCAIVF